MKNKLNHTTFLIIVVYLTINSFFSFLPTGQAGSQDKTKIDSLKNLLNTTIEDTTRIKTLNKLAWELKYNNPDTSIILSTQALELSEKVDWKKGIAKSHHNLGVFNWRKGNYPLALDHYFKALKIWKQLAKEQPPPAFAKAMAGTLGNIGSVYLSQGDYPKALEYYFKSLKIQEEIGDKSGIAITLGTIGIVYYNQGDYPKALEYYFKALKMAEELENKNLIAVWLGNIGIVYYSQASEASPASGGSDSLYNKALEYYFKALKMNEELGNKNYIAIQFGNIGAVYDDQGDYPKALEYYFKALKMQEELGARREIAINLGNIGSLYTEQKKYPEAEHYLLQALEVSTDIGALLRIKKHHQYLSELYEQTAQYQKAYEHYKAYSIAKDTIYNEEKSKEIGKLEAGYEYDKQKAVTEAEHKKELEKQEAVAVAESKRQKVVIYAVSGGMGLMLLLAFFIYRGYRQKQKANLQLERKNITITRQKKEIEEKNKDITDSIRYAENIQKAILPSIEEIKKGLPDSFILFKPKDIVSGDFYFFSQINQYTIIAACDCTGHGVPGAFMSMIGSQLLNEIVNDKSVTDAAEVLNQLRDGIIHALGEAGATGEQKDGMDMSLCAFRYDKDIGIVNVQFAGAYNPLYLIRKGELQQIKADKQPVGFHYGEQMPFTNHNISLQKGDTIYLFSDGYQDQFGGPRGKKFMSKKLRQLFIEIQTMNMEKQKEHLDKTIEDWKGGKEQVDDILVIGVKV